MKPLKEIFLVFSRKWKKGTAEDNKPLSSKDYDFVAMRQRACDAIFANKRDLREIEKFMGIDINIPIHKRTPLLPTMQNIRKAAEIIGISVGFLLTGKPETEADRLTMAQIARAQSATLECPSDCKRKKKTVINRTRDAYNSVIVQGSNISTLVINNEPGAGLTAREWDLVHAFRGLDTRGQTAVCSELFAVQESQQIEA